MPIFPTLTIYFLKDPTPQFGKWKHKEEVKESIVTPIPSKKSDKNTGHIEGKKTQK